MALVGCASGPGGGGAGSGGVVVRPGRDGPEPNPPSGLQEVPDAEPVVEAIRIGGPNKPYEVMGRSYVPITDDRPFSERGLASWYGRLFHGRPTASGERYDMYRMTAAHPTLPIPSYARVRNPANGREVIVRINDRGPFHPGRIVDLSYTAALKLDLLRGVAPVELTRLTFEEIRTGAWRRPTGEAGGTVTAAAAPRTAAPASGAATPGNTTVEVDDPILSVAARGNVAADAGETAVVAAPSGPWLQLGAFRDRAGAEGLQRRMAVEGAWLGSVRIAASSDGLWRVQSGPYRQRDEAMSVAQRVREVFGLKAAVVEPPPR